MANGSPLTIAVCKTIETARCGSIQAAIAALMRDTVPLPTPTAFAIFFDPISRRQPGA
jgi:hypothetical protein